MINKLVQVAKMKLPELDDKIAAQYGEFYPEWGSRICTRSLAQSVWKLTDLVGLNVTIV